MKKEGKKTKGGRRVAFHLFYSKLTMIVHDHEERQWRQTFDSHSSSRRMRLFEIRLHFFRSRHRDRLVEQHLNLK